MARRSAEDTRTDLLEAATSEFIVRGLRGTSLADIARGAGYSKATVLYHFQSKEQLILEWSAGPLAAVTELGNQVHATTDPVARQRIAALGFIDLAFEYRTIVRLMWAEIPYVFDESAGAEIEAWLCTALTGTHNVIKARIITMMFASGVVAAADLMEQEDHADVRQTLIDLALQILPDLAAAAELGSPDS